MPNHSARASGDNVTAAATRINGNGVTPREDAPRGANACVWSVAFACNLRAQRGIGEVAICASGPASGGRTLRLNAMPSDLAAVSRQHALLREALVAMFDRYLPPAVKQPKLQ